MTPLEEVILQYFEDPKPPAILPIYLQNRSYNLSRVEIQAKLEEMLLRRLLVVDDGRYFAVRR